MLDRLRPRRGEPAPPRYADGRRMYCIGDIHGRDDLLDELHRRILGDADGCAAACEVLYLGDYVDRGEQSRQVLDRLTADPLPGFAAIHLLGNHEQAMLDFMADPELMAGWLTWGGLATLRSYGIHLGAAPTRAQVAAAGQRLQAELPAAHRAFLENCRPAHAAGDYYFVHAGIRPGVPLHRQALEDQLWIRGDFIDSRADHGAVIVHGHSIREEPELLPNRIGIDTGAFYTGVLTCLVLEGETRRLLQTGAPE